MSEVDLVRNLQFKASELGHRLWRNVVSQAWVGAQIRVSRPQMIMMQPGDLLLRGAKPIHAGLAVGSSDLIGIAGDGSGRFLAVEAKMPKGRVSDQQESFIEQVNRMGGIGIVAKTLEDFKV